MAMRPTWKGFLKISLVNIPVRVFPATDSAATISFNQLHKECQTRIQQKKWCPRCNKELTQSDIVKGYEFEKGHWVVVEDEDIEKVRPESTRVINLVQFTDIASLDPIYFERPYYLGPDGDVAADAFGVIRDGMAGKAGIGRLAIHGREYVVAVQPRERGLVMYTLRQAAEVRAMDQIEELERVPMAVKPAEAKLARQVIETFESPLDVTEFRDQYQEELRKVIDAKIAGQEIVAPVEEAPAKVVNLMDALRRSLDSVSAGKKTPAKATLTKISRAETPEAEAADTARPARAAGGGRRRARG
jgi:DNA end-binding protein Ku